MRKPRLLLSRDIEGQQSKARSAARLGSAASSSASSVRTSAEGTVCRNTPEHADGDCPSKLEGGKATLEPPCLTRDDSEAQTPRRSPTACSEHDDTGAPRPRRHHRHGLHRYGSGREVGHGRVAVEGLEHLLEHNRFHRVVARRPPRRRRRAARPQLLQRHEVGDGRAQMLSSLFFFW